MVVRIIVLSGALLLALTSCTSSHNLDTDGANLLGGGYNVRDHTGGKFYITAKTNWAPVENLEAAREMWSELAEEACGGSDYEEEIIREYSYESLPAFFGIVKYIVSAKEGYAVCQTAGNNKAPLPATNSGS